VGSSKPDFRVRLVGETVGPTIHRQGWRSPGRSPSHRNGSSICPRARNRTSLPVRATSGESVRRVDVAWPGSHIRRMYDSLSRSEASILAQLRTGMTPLNVYLYLIGASQTSLCDCDEAAEPRQHFTSHCRKCPGSVEEQQRSLSCPWGTSSPILLQRHPLRWPVWYYYSPRCPFGPGLATRAEPA